MSNYRRPSIGLWKKIRPKFEYTLYCATELVFNTFLPSVLFIFITSALHNPVKENGKNIKSRLLGSFILDIICICVICEKNMKSNCLLKDTNKNVTAMRSLCLRRQADCLLRNQGLRRLPSSSQYNYDGQTSFAVLAGPIMHISIRKYLIFFLTYQVNLFEHVHPKHNRKKI